MALDTDAQENKRRSRKIASVQDSRTGIKQKWSNKRAKPKPKMKSTYVTTAPASTEWPTSPAVPHYPSGMK
jgi:hypothetical protein